MTPPFKKGTPYTNANAKPVRFRKIKNKLAIKLNGMYRDAKIRGTFAVHPHKRPFRIDQPRIQAIAHGTVNTVVQIPVFNSQIQRIDQLARSDGQGRHGDRASHVLKNLGIHASRLKDCGEDQT